eukprot:g6667.t1
MSGPNEEKTCSVSQAISEFGCLESDLKKLSHTWVGYYLDLSLSMERFYLIAEVKHLGRISALLRKREEKCKQRKERLARNWRRRKLEQLHGLKVSKIRPILRPFILGDTLLTSRPKTSIDDVKQRYSSLNRITELMDVCKAHPQSALDYCMDNPHGSVQEYVEFREIMRTVFFMEGNRILLMLSPVNRTRLECTVLADVLAQFRERNLQFLVLQKLQFCVDIDTAKQIWNLPACQKRIERGGDESKLATELIAFWKTKDDPKQRREDLQSALEAHGLTLRTDSVFCREYINGKIDADLDEIVGIMMITSRLFEISHVAWSQYRHRCEAKFRDCLLGEELTLEQSITRALKKVPENLPDHIRNPRRHQFSDSDDDSYWSE